MSRLINYGVFASSFFTGPGVVAGPIPPNARWDIKSAALESSNKASTTISDPAGSFVKPDGTEVYFVGFNNSTATISQLSFSTGYDFTSQTNEKFLDVSAQNTFVADVSIKADGTTLYFVGGSGGSKTMYAYTLSTPWDITTASYTSTFTNNFDGEKIHWSLDGAFLFGADQTTVYAHASSSPWSFSLSSAGNFSLAGCIGGGEIVRSVFVKPDGTEMYIATNSDISLEGVEPANYIYQFGLLTAWDVSSALFEGNYEDAAAAGLLQDIYINPNTGTDVVITTSGQILYLNIALLTDYDDPIIFRNIDATGGDTLVSGIGTQGFEESDWNSYFPSFKGIGELIPFDTGTSTNISLAGTTLPIPVIGTAVIAKDGCSTGVIRGALGSVVSEQVIIQNTPIDINNASYDNVRILSRDSSPSGLAFNNNGTKMFVVGYGSDVIREFTLATAFDLSAVTNDSITFSVRAQDSNPRGIQFNNDGTKLYMVGEINDSVFQYTLSNPFDLTTISYDDVSVDIGGVASLPEDLVFNNNGSKMYIVDSSADAVFQYSLSTAFDISTAVYDNILLDVGATNQYSANGLAFNNNGERLFIVGSGSDNVNQYILGTAFDISTAVYNNVFFDPQTSGSPEGITFGANGTKMYIADRYGSEYIWQYSVNGTVNGDLITTEWTADISALGLDSVPTVLCLDALPSMSTIFVPLLSDLTLPDIAVEHTKVIRQEWVGEYIRTLFKKVIQPGNRVIQSKFISDPTSEVRDARYYLTKEVPGTRDTTGLDSPFIVEDFEDNVFVFTFSGDWARSNVKAYEGSYSFASTNQNNNSTTSATEATLTLVVPSEISFWWNVSSENSYDFLNVYINGTKVVEASGSSGWTFYRTAVLDPGAVLFRAEYTKDGSVSGSDDTGYIDLLKVNSDFSQS
jgi:hypothetical protein